MNRFLLLCLAALAASICSPARSPEPAAELEKLVTGAAAGDPVAQFDLGMRYFVGDGVPQDYGKAADLWRPLAERGVPPAMNNAGYLTYYGLGVPEDPAAGVALWRRAVKLGEPESSFHLRHAALEGRAVPLDSAEAFARFRAAMLMPGATPDSVDQKVIAMAAEKLRELRPRLSESAITRGNALARAYTTEHRERSGT